MSESGQTSTGISTTAEIRNKVVEVIDKALSVPFLKEDTKRVLRAQRSFWQSAEEADLSRLLKLFQDEP